MKRMSNHLALALTLVMLLTMLAGVQVSAAPAQEGTVAAQTVTYEDVTAEIFRYTPEDFEFRGNNTPLLFVLSDTTFTAETAAQMLNTKGFKTIADEESCSVLFVSPKNGESWTEDDYKALQILAGNATDDFYIGTDYSAGIDENGYFYAGRWRHYIFAEGSAVEFAQTMLEAEDAGYFMPQWSGWVDGFGAGFVYAKDGFTVENVAAGWQTVRHTTRLYNNNNTTFLAPYYYWEEEGITETAESIKLDYEDIPELPYYLYVPDTVDLDSTTEKYPLVLAFHGNALHPQAHIQNTRWPLVAKENKFVVVAVNGLYGTTSNADAIADLVDYMIENYAIDATRVYSTGYSKGTMETLNFAQSYTEKLAGIGLFEPVFGLFPIYQPTTTLPVYAIIGQDEFFPVFPSHTEKAAESLNAIGKVNGFTYTYDEKIGGYWGYRFDLTESLRLPEERGVMHIHSIISKDDGVVYTKLVDAYQLGHNVLPSSAWEMWDFLAQFSRNADGTLTVNESNPYKDVAKNDWYYYDVQASAKANLFCGTSATTFAPTETTTRAMMVTVLYRLAGQPEAMGSSPFTDVAKDSWYEDAVNWASENGIVNGVSADCFAPNEMLTREQAATMLYRYAKYCGEDTSVEATLTDFNDIDKISSYAKDDVAWAVDADVIQGMPDGAQLSLAPQEGAERAQAAVMLLRFADLVSENGIE